MSEPVLRAVADDVWVARQKQRFGVIELGARMTVIRLSDGGLWVHSPIRPTETLVADVEKLGTVADIVAPNRVHHLYAGEFLERFPAAKLYLAPGLDTKRPDLRPANLLVEDAPERWRADLDWVFFDGIPFASEVVFLHRPSRSLLLCDLAFNVDESLPRMTRAVFRLWGLKGFGASRFEKFLLRDKAAARKSADVILEWDFDRVIVSHGSILETGGKQALRESFDWLLS